MCVRKLRHPPLYFSAFLGKVGESGELGYGGSGKGPLQFAKICNQRIDLGLTLTI